MIIELPNCASEVPRLPDEQNIIPISGEASEELDIVLADQRKDTYCPNFHRRVFVDEHRRILICQDCKKAIEAFDFVRQWACEADRKNRALVNIEARTKIARAEFELLEKRIDSIRGKLKRAGQPQPEAERMDYKHRLLNAEQYAKPSEP